jgi:hypothetical protein
VGSEPFLGDPSIREGEDQSIPEMLIEVFSGRVTDKSGFPGAVPLVHVYFRVFVCP